MRLLSTLWLLALTLPASGDVFSMPSGQTSLEFVPVGDPGNPLDRTTGLGVVTKSYSLGKFEVTIGQYTQFLNAVAKTDTYGLYDMSMSNNFVTAGVARSGASGNYTYSVIGSPNRPISYVGWGDAARFANWLTNGQPNGAQGLTTTENGSYFLNGTTSSVVLSAVTRSPNARYVIPTDNEWYKAAYYDPAPGAGGGDNYWSYPMRTDTAPYSDEPPGSTAPDSRFTANFFNDDHLVNGYNDGYAVTGTSTPSTGQNVLSDVGAYSAALSYYGTFDQGGNVWEWTELARGSSDRACRGGSWSGIFDPNSLKASLPFNFTTVTAQNSFTGFRIAEVPEPATLGATLLAAGCFLRRRSPTRHFRCT